MRIGIVGLGRMGRQLALRLHRAGFEPVGHDLDETARAGARQDGLRTVGSLRELAESLECPRRLWVMVPAGEPTDAVLRELLELLEPGDSVVDGGNSNYLDSMARAERFHEKGLGFLDVGTSGGVWGLENGYCLMVGGSDSLFAAWSDVFQALAPSPDAGWVHAGPSGAGHYAKMVHNAIEYGMMQALAEGLELLQAKPLVRDVGAVAEAWRHGSVVRSWLLDLAAKGLREEPGLETLAPHVSDSGEGRWAVEESVRLGVPTPVIATSLYARFSSRQENSFAARVLAMLRRQFGGHAVQRRDEGQR